MLERATGCLERPLLRFFRESKHCLRSRRLLHSKFWSHGASEIDAASWWPLFLAAARESSIQDGEPRTKQGSSQTSADWLFLEFLYPSHTLAFLQRCSTYGVHALISRRRKMASKARCRSYTSATETWPRGDDVRPDMSTPEPFNRTEDDAESPVTLLRRILKSPWQSPKNFDLAWNVYDRIENPLPYLPQMIMFLSYSHRKVDYERVVSLISSLSAAERRKIRLRERMPELVMLSDNDFANDRLFKALAEADRSLQSTAILSGFVDHRQWHLAAQLLKAYEVETSGRLNWEEVDTLSTLLHRTFGLFRFLDDEASTVKGSIDALASRLATRVLKNHKIMKTIPFDEIQYLFNALRKSRILARGHYTFAILSLLATSREIGLSETLYQEMSRNRNQGPPTQSVLGSLLRAFSELDSYWGIHKVLEDFDKFYGGPDEEAYLTMITAYARLGDDKRVNQLFDEYCSRFGSPTNLEFLTPLLYVHARIGNVPQAVAQFKRLSVDFKVTPNVYCWNILLFAHARAGNLEGAFEIYRNLIGQGIEPDAYSFGTLMGMLANRGDTDGVQYLLDLAVQKNIKLTTPLIDTLVEALCHNGEVYEALDLLKDATKMDLIGTRTRMWNIVLCAFASQKDIWRVRDTYNQMMKFRIPFDDMTYAALMGCLTRIGRTGAALQVLTQVMPHKGFLPKPFHYALVLQGYAHEGNRDMVYVIYQKILEIHKTPNLSSNLFFLATAIKRDLLNSQSREGGPDGFDLPNAEKFLESALQYPSHDALASKEPRPGTFRLPLHESYPAAFFDKIMTTFGSRGAFGKVEKLFDEYIKRRQTLPALEESITPPIRILSALMVSHLRQGEHEQIAELWRMAVPRAIQFAQQLDIPSTLDPSPPPPAPNNPSILVSSMKSKDPLDMMSTKILPSQRFILSLPFQHYMSSLAAQALYDEIASTISFLESAGFALSTKNWNDYIIALSVSSLPSDQFSAFVLCESLLMPNFPLNWRMMTANYGTDPLKRDTWWTSKKEKLVDQRYYPGHLQPTYLTMVYLGAAFLKFRERSAFDGGAEISRLREETPQTTEALTVMPKMKDEAQGVLLRGESRMENIPQVEKEHPVTLETTARPTGRKGSGGKPRLYRAMRKELLPPKP